MPLRTLLLLAAAGSLAACQPDAPAETAPDPSAPPEAVTDGVPPDTAMVRDATPAGTARLVEALTEASPSVAIQTIDVWIARLDTLTTDEPMLAQRVGSVRSGLDQLRSQLQSSPLDGRAIGETMRDLGRGTTELARPGSPLSDLGRALTAGAERLTPAPEPAGDGVSNNEE